MLNSWQVVDELPALLDDDVHVWRIELPVRPAFLEACYGLLSTEESARAERRLQLQARQQFVVGRGALRRILGAVTAADPRMLPLEAEPGGKPGLACSEIAFNVAHSGDTILIAVRRKGLLGVDVERIDPAMAWMEVAQDSFTAAENFALAALRDTKERRRLFYRLWTRKEAVAKADGRGLALPFGSFEVPASALETMTVTLERHAGARSFYVMDLPLGSSLAGALATDSSVHQMKLLVFPQG
jgi:4'-phosphopantetheinyl transferase